MLAVLFVSLVLALAWAAAVSINTQHSVAIINAAAAALEIHDVQDMLSSVSTSGGERTNATMEIATTMAQVNHAAQSARAGRGFAVVAAEVQVLAQQSATASEAIGHVAADQHAEIMSVIAALDRASNAVREAAESQATVAAAVDFDAVARSLKDQVDAFTLT